VTSAGAALAASLVVLAVHNLGVERLRPSLYVPASLGTTATLMALSATAGIGGGELGLSAAGLGTGVAVGAVVAAVVGGVALLPATMALFADRRMEGVGPVGTAYRALVRIPFGTVVLEEVAFRGVLLALLARSVPVGWAVVGSSLLFGLWHVVPFASTLRTNRLAARPMVVGAAALAASVVGAGLCWLRLLTGGVIAPAIVHASATGSAVVVAFVVGRRDYPTDHDRPSH
jgi:uncharacterized protein